MSISPVFLFFLFSLLWHLTALLPQQKSDLQIAFPTSHTPVPPLFPKLFAPKSIAAQLLEGVWDVDSLDWKDLSAGEITKRVTSKVQPGSIVLFHNAALHTPEALPDIIQCLLQEGYTFVPISQMILSGEYTIDHTGRQCPA